MQFVYGIIGPDPAAATDITMPVLVVVAVIAVILAIGWVHRARG